MEIVTDRVKTFMDGVLREYLALLDVHHLPTTPYTPRSNGQVERMHRPLAEILTKLSKGDRTRWDYYLPQAVSNSRLGHATGFSAFYLCHGVEPRLPGDSLPSLPPDAYDLNDDIDRLNYTARELARLGQNRAAALKSLQVQALKMKERYDREIMGESTIFRPR